MTKAIYFDPDKFVTSVIEGMKLGNVTATTLLALKDEIEGLLGDRILATVIRNMETKEIVLFNNMLEDHPELTEIDALMVMAPNIPGLKEKLERSINSLYVELVYDAEQIENKLNPKTV